MTPNSDGSEIRAANQLVGDMRNNIAQRQLGYLGQLPLQERDSGWNLWVNTLYGHGTQSGNDYATGFRINRYGISLAPIRRSTTAPCSASPSAIAIARPTAAV